MEHTRRRLRDCRPDRDACRASHGHGHCGRLPTVHESRAGGGDRVDHRSDISGARVRGVRDARRLAAARGSLIQAGSVTHDRCDVLRALATDPDDRFANVREFVDAIDAPAKTIVASWMRPLLARASVAALIALSRRGRPARRSVARGPGMTKDTLALALYRRGRADVATRNEANMRDAVTEFSARASSATPDSRWLGQAWRARRDGGQRGFVIPGRSTDSLIALSIVASQRAVAMDSSSADVWLVRARVMESVEPTSRTAVLNDLRRALAADSTDGEVWFALGRAREELLDSAGARAAFVKALTLDPSVWSS